MLPSDGTTLFSNNNKVWYDKDGSMQSSFFPTATWSSDGTADGANGEIANTIKHPYTFNKSRRMDYLYYNLWDTNCNETSSTSITTARFEPVKKSVYDPCPPGFCLPPNGAFTGFTKIGAYAAAGSEKNTYGLFSYGWHFRTVLLGEPDAAIDPTIFFHASGYRSNNGNIQGNFGSEGAYWSSVPNSVSYGCRLNFAVGRVFPMSSYDNSAGFVLRPVKE